MADTEVASPRTPAMRESARDDASTADGEPVPVPRQVHCELQALRQMGGFDLYSPDILDVLAAYDFGAARQWATANPDRYVRAIETGTVDETVTDGSDADR